MLIKDTRLRKALLRALADDQSSLILAATSRRPLSAMDLVHDLGLPSSSAYLRLHELEETGLLAVARTALTRDGKKYQTYKATFREVSVRFNAGEIVVSAVPNEDVVTKAFRLFHSFEEEGD
jgi:DNA-binding transcriptional ArsR family regulator